METKVRICVERKAWYTRRGVTEAVEIRQKSLQDGKYRDIVTVTGKGFFEEITAFLRERGRKLPGGDNRWREYYEVDIADAIELYRKLNVTCADAKLWD